MRSRKEIIMKRFFRYLGIGVITGIIGGFILSSFTRGPISVVISSILGALIGGYWKYDKGAWIGGAIMCLAPLILLVLLLMGMN